MYSSKVTGKRQITIPLEICKKLEITTGDQVEFIIERDKIIFEKVKLKDEDICPYCNQLVYIITNHVNFEGRKYHMECWYENKK